eukprot:CAMPEP_0183291192 /NCGR_PEP_ID=MMETSP0160_2-20130417/690_1 /TAXON_ID=2839 ORGANISM="Odontella Sinensis, Strain Grunow 1884" /NCGR_SAMPLE_ID=MMETSP0160_2 /ASSEMBLY_ACC=CAM_ASM_000250 /LENGTH=261 /DNA_ID=CAMNT_0025451957 /DNA_START=45 /DNA_END=830 /DNA_ORIENTATION=-
MSATTSPVPLIGTSDPIGPSIIEAFETLDKWKGCRVDGAPKRMVYEHNRSRAAGSGFPSCMELGLSRGLSEHEVASLFGWTTGDYRWETVEFEDYPFLPNKMTKVKCHLTRDDVMPYVHVLGSALSKLPPLLSTQTLWRGHRRKLDSTDVGGIVILKGFTSVTRDRDTASEFVTKANEGRSGERTLLAFLDHKSSRCIAKFSALNNEMEVMFPLDTTFEIVSPPEGGSGEDQKAVEAAVRRLQKEMPEAEIDLVYLKEIPG